MSKSKKKLIQNGFEIFTRIFMKYDSLGSKPVDIGNGIKVNAANIHTIEAIGKGYANTVTSLSIYFMITKGAVSQVISKLHKEGYIKKTEVENKVVLLELTALGNRALEAHDTYNLSVIQELQTIEKKYTNKEIETFIKILSEVDNCLSGYLTDLNRK